MRKPGNPAENAKLRARLLRLLQYRPTSGKLTWRVARQGGYAVPGEPAGAVDARGNVRVCVDGVLYSANRLIYFMQSGFWPTTRLSFADGNPRNLAWRNIIDAPPRGTHAARYQRELRELNLEAAERIKNDPELSGLYYAADNAEARRILASVRDDIRHERHNDASPDMPRVGDDAPIVQPSGMRTRRSRPAPVTPEDRS